MFIKKHIFVSFFCIFFHFSSPEQTIQNNLCVCRRNYIFVKFSPQYHKPEIFPPIGIYRNSEHLLLTLKIIDNIYISLEMLD